MKNVRSIILLMMIGALLGVLGCSKDNNITQVQPLTDEQALKAQVTRIDTAITEFSASEEATIDDIGLRNPEYEDGAGIVTEEVALGKVSADSTYPIRWGRHLDWDHIVRDYHVVMENDSTAIVTMTKTIPGDFRVGWGIRTPDTTIVDTIIKKSFIEVVKRVIHFKRIAHTNNPLRNWKPIAITMVEGKTESGNQFSIVSLEVSENQVPYDMTFTDPLNTWFRLGIFHSTMPIFPVRDTVTVRVTISSADSDAEIVHLRHGIGGGHMNRRRSAMTLISTAGGSGNYTRVYEKTFRTGLPREVLAARFNAVVDVISRGSIYDLTAPLSNEFWGMPYIIVR